MKAERIEEPTEPGWYQARWWTPNIEAPSRWGCVFVDEMASGELMVLHPTTNTWSPLSIISWWGESIDAVFAERDRARALLDEGATRIEELRAERDRLATEVAELREQRDAARRGLAVAEATLSRIDDDDLPACDEHDYRHAASGMYGDAEADRLFPRPAPGGPTT